MVRSKEKVGRGVNKAGPFDVDPDDQGARDDRRARKSGGKGRPRREMRERIEVRDEERTLTRELSDWDSYQDEFDSNSDSDSDRSL